MSRPAVGLQSLESSTANKVTDCVGTETEGGDSFSTINVWTLKPFLVLEMNFPA